MLWGKFIIICLTPKELGLNFNCKNFEFILEKMKMDMILSASRLKLMKELFRKSGGFIEYKMYLYWQHREMCIFVLVCPVSRIFQTSNTCTLTRKREKD